MALALGCQGRARPVLGLALSSVDTALWPEKERVLWEAPPSPARSRDHRTRTAPTASLEEAFVTRKCGSPASGLSGSSVHLSTEGFRVRFLSSSRVPGQVRSPPWLGLVWEATNRCVSSPLPLLPSFSPLKRTSGKTASLRRSRKKERPCPRHEAASPLHGQRCAVRWV